MMNVCNANMRLAHALIIVMNMAMPEPIVLQPVQFIVKVSSLDGHLGWHG